jgi:hypothetical protein
MNALAVSEEADSEGSKNSAKCSARTLSPKTDATSANKTEKDSA